VTELKKEAPTELSRREKTAWAKERYEQHLRSKLGLIDTLLKPGVVLTASFENGELILFVDNMEVIRIYLHDKEGSFIASQWKYKLHHTNITEKFDAKKLLKLLLSLRKTQNEALSEQIVQLDKQVDELNIEIELKETDMNTLTFALYHLTVDEIAMVLE
jgi:hypothetical protein